VNAADVELVLAGTGDAFGNGGRLQTCFILRDGDDAVMIDCGASSLTALKAAVRTVQPSSGERHSAARRRSARGVLSTSRPTAGDRADSRIGHQDVLDAWSTTIVVTHPCASQPSESLDRGCSPPRPARDQTPAQR
jgi:hypothetical protein